MELLKEYYQIELSQDQLNEAVAAIDRNNGPMLLKRILLQKANAKNRNGRIYPRPVLEREVNRYNEEMVKTRRALGECDHIDSNIVNLKNVSHLVTEIWWEGDDVFGNIEILNSPEFPAGMIAAGLLKRRIPVGISSRALGSVSEVNGVSMVNEDLQLSCWDLVSFESTIGSFMNLQEAHNAAYNKYKTVDDIIHKIICNHTKTSL